jgi:hypothetical protein
MTTDPTTPAEPSSADPDPIIGDELLQQVITAVINMAGRAEVDLAELASEGRLHEVFPFRLRDLGPSTLEKWDDVVEAPARPLSDEEYLKFLRRTI